MTDPTSTPYTITGFFSGNGYSGTVTFEATGGPVAAWSVLPPAPPQSWGLPYASPSAGGKLLPGTQVTVTLGTNNPPRANPPYVFTIEPGNIQVSVYPEVIG